MIVKLWKPRRNLAASWLKVVYEKENGSHHFVGAIQAFESTQKYVTGEVKFKLYKGNIIKAGTTSPYSLYNESCFLHNREMYTITMMPIDSSLCSVCHKVRAMKLAEVESQGTDQ